MNLMDLFIKIGVDDQASSKIEGLSSKLGKGLKTAGNIAVKTITAVSSAVLAVGGYAVKVGSDFEAQMSKVSAISGATGDDLQALTDKAMQLGIDTQFSATEAGQAFEYMAMAGWKTEEMLNGVAGIMDLAAASGEELALVSDIVTDALTGFGLTAADSGHFADVLAAASSNANTNVAMMGETFKYAAPVAGALGFSIEDTATAIGLMANSGIKGSQAGTALRSMFTRLAKPTKESAEAMAKIGLEITNTDGSMKSLQEIMSDMRVGFEDMTEAEQAETAAMLAGQEAMSGLLAIVNASDEEFAKLTDAIYSADGAAEKMATTMLDNLQGQMTLLKSSAEGFGLAIYEEIQEPLTEMASWAIEALNSITEGFRSGGVDGMVAAAGEIIGQLVTGLTERLPDIINLAIELVRSFLKGITDNVDLIAEGAVETITSFITGILNMLPDIISAGLDLLLALVEGIVENLPELLAAADEVIEKLCEMLTDPELLSRLLDAAIAIVIQLTKFIIENIPELLDAAMKIIINLVDYLLDPENIEKLLGAALDLILALADGLIKSAASIALGVTELTAKIIEFLFEIDWAEQGKKLLTGLWDGLKALWPSLESWLTSVGDGIISAFTSVITSVKNLFNGDNSGGWAEDAALEALDKQQKQERKNQYYYVDENGKIVFDESAYAQAEEQRRHVAQAKLSTIIGGGVTDIFDSAFGDEETAININIDGETVASVMYPHLQKTIQQKGAGF